LPRKNLNSIPVLESMDNWNPTLVSKGRLNCLLAYLLFVGNAING
jgi:hypothetical protein